MSKRVVFVCMGNSCRSPMAEALFRKQAEEKDQAYVVESRGLRVNSGGSAAREGIAVRIKQ